MGHKALIGGTAYDIAGGKTLLGGTAYDIVGGKTLLGGTGYDITFGSSAIPTLEELFAVAGLTGISGNNTRSGGRFSVALPAAGTYYAFSVCAGHMGIFKVVYDGSSCTVTALGGNYTGSYGQIYTDRNTVSYSSNGSSSTSARGTLAVFTFGGDYTERQVDAALKALTLTKRASKDSSNQQGAVSTSVISDARSYLPGYFFGAAEAYLELAYIQRSGTKTQIYSNSLLGLLTCGTNGTSSNYLILSLSNGAPSYYGGSIIQVEQAA